MGKSEPSGFMVGSTLPFVKPISLPISLPMDAKLILTLTHRLCV